jgi:acetate---CoA ligase (ADP-forming)
VTTGLALDAVLRPGRVGVIGASARRRTLGNQVLDNLRARGFPGEVTVVHPRGEPIGDWPTARSAAELTDRLDVAVVCLPSASVVAVLSDLDGCGCRAAVVPTAGFTHEQACELTRACSESTMTVHGPNCLGVFSVADRAPLWTARLRPDLPVGPVAVVAQSGSAAISMMTAAELGFSRVVSTGNELAVTTADYLDWLARDDATEAVAAIVESIRDPAHFAAAAAALRAANKPLVALKVGRTAGGTRATVAHTGALVNAYDTYRAFFRNLGVPLVSDYDELVATLHCMVAYRHARPRGSSIGVVAISGGQSALACDLVDEMGASVATFAEATRERVRRALRGVGGDNPVDINASVDPGRNAPAALEAVLADPSVDSVLVVQDAQETLPLSDEHPYVQHVAMIVALAGATHTPVVIASSSSAAIHPLIAELVAGSAVPLIRGLRAAVVALRGLADPGAQSPAPGSEVGQETVRGLRAALHGIAGTLPRQLTRRILAAYGLPVCGSELVVTEAEAAPAAQRLGFPVVVKVVSPEIPHRADVGGVVVDVHSGEQAAAAVAAIRDRIRAAAPGATIGGFELQRQVLGAVEVLVGCASAPPFGATVVVGSGGALAELAGDARIELTPVSTQRARAMIDSTTAGTVLAGYRNLVAPTDVAQLAAVVERLSWLANDLADLLSGVDLNPVLVEPGSGRVTIVDALLTSATAAV